MNVRRLVLAAYTFSTLLRTAFAAIHLAPVTLGTNVLVVGMGIVGNLTAQLYRGMGAGLVAGADFSRTRLSRAESMGAIDVGFPVVDAPLTERVSELGPYGAELVIDAVGLPSSIDSCMKSVAPGGRVVLLGSPRQRMEFDPYPDIHSKGVTIIGAHTSTVSEEARRRDRELVSKYIDEERIKVMPLVTHRLSLDKAQQAYEGLRDNFDDFVGVLFDYA